MDGKQRLVNKTITPLALSEVTPEQATAKNGPVLSGILYLLGFFFISTVVRVYTYTIFL